MMVIVLCVSQIRHGQSTCLVKRMNMSGECDKCGEHALNCECFNKYYLSTSFSPEVEVSKEKFMETERACGFYAKIEGRTATDGFGFFKDGMEIKGKVLRHRPKAQKREKLNELD
jgi:hypothetical protein